MSRVIDVILAPAREAVVGRQRIRSGMSGSNWRGYLPLLVE